jgi:hypothetical protein
VTVKCREPRCRERLIDWSNELEFVVSLRHGIGVLG